MDLRCLNCGYEIEDASERGFCSTCEKAYQLGKGESQPSIWKSELTAEMVSSLSDQEISLLVEALNTAVEEICTNWGTK